MYLGLVILTLGIAIWVGVVPMLVVPLAVVATANWVHIPFEKLRCAASSDRLTRTTSDGCDAGCKAASGTSLRADCQSSRCGCESTSLTRLKLSNHDPSIKVCRAAVVPETARCDAERAVTPPRRRRLVFIENALPRPSLLRGGHSGGASHRLGLYQTYLTDIRSDHCAADVRRAFRGI